MVVWVVCVVVEDSKTVRQMWPITCNFQGFQHNLAGGYPENALFSLSLQHNAVMMKPFSRSTTVTAARCNNRSLVTSEPWLLGTFRWRGDAYQNCCRPLSQRRALLPARFPRAPSQLKRKSRESALWHPSARLRLRRSSPSIKIWRRCIRKSKP
jgi:hypothetical protein